MRPRARAESPVKLNVYRVSLKRQVQEKDENGAPVTREVRLFSGHRTLSEYGIERSVALEMKDLGPQFAYRGVFFWEYLGPILVFALMAMRPSFLYGAGAADRPMSNVAMCVERARAHASQVGLPRVDPPLRQARA